MDIHSIIVSNLSYEIIVHVPNEYDYHYMIMENVKDLIFACYVARQFNSALKEELVVIKIDIEFIGYLAVKERDVGGQPLEKLRKIEHKVESISYPIKFEIFTFNFFEREHQFTQTIFSDTSCRLALKDLTYKKVINKSRYGRVVVARDIKTKRNYAVKYLHKWKISEWNQDDLFQKLSLRLSKFKDSIYTARLRYACTTRAFLIIVTDFYKGGSLHFHIREKGMFSEEVVRVLSKKILKEIEKYHKDNKIVLDLRSDNVFLDSLGNPQIQVCTSSKFHAYNITNKKFESDISYICNFF